MLGCTLSRSEALQALALSRAHWEEGVDKPKLGEVVLDDNPSVGCVRFGLEVALIPIVDPPDDDALGDDMGRSEDLQEEDEERQAEARQQVLVAAKAMCAWQSARGEG